MPTVEELPQAQSVGAADLLPISQSGTLCAIASGELLASTQSAIMAPTGSLLGRNSLGAGGPEPVSVGLGLSLQSGTIAATGGDHASFPVELTLGATDQFVLSAAGSPKLAPLSALSLALAGSASNQFANFPVVTNLAGTDLVAVSQGGTNAAITLANLLNGETIDQASAAEAASDSDTFWVAQGGSTMLRQTFSAIWTWTAGKLPTYKLPVLELTADTTLDSSVHNGHLLVCSAAITLTPAFQTMGSGFFCDVLNLSAGEITFGAGIIVSSGQTALGSNQFATLRGVTYSQGNVVFAAISSPVAAAASSGPGQVTTVSVSGITAAAASLSWGVPTSGGSPTNYVIQYSVSGANAWSSTSVPGTSTSAALSGLAASTAYVATVTAANAGGTSAPSAAVSFTTLAAVIAPGQVSGLAISAVQPTSLQLSWSAPATGGTATGYQVQYSSAGAPGWTTYASNLSATSISVDGLSAGTAYTFQVIASNADGAGPASASISATTPAAGGGVSSITWNVTPAGPYAAGSGSIGINVHVSPATAPVQFGLSSTATTPPTSWVAGGFVNTDLWGAYLPIPPATGTYYAWCEGTDGSALTVYATAFVVQ